MDARARYQQVDLSRHSQLVELAFLARQVHRPRSPLHFNEELDAKALSYNAIVSRIVTVINLAYLEILLLPHHKLVESLAQACATIAHLQPALYTFYSAISSKKLRLMCLVWPNANPNEHIVNIEINNDKTVSALKKLIKLEHARRLHEVDACDLVLWKCSISDDDHLKETLNAIRFDVSDPSVQQLVPVTLLLSEHFVAGLSLLAIHIVVREPPLGEYEPGSSNGYPDFWQ